MASQSSSASAVHARSPYVRGVDFAALARFDARLAPFLLARTGAPDWRSAPALAAATRALLARDFALGDWRLPADRLCPTVTSRLNYLLWVQDLLAGAALLAVEDPDAGAGADADAGSAACDARADADADTDVGAAASSGADAVPAGAGSSPAASRGASRLAAAPLGIDVGTGASCIYALLGARACGFRTLGTDIDARSAAAAAANVARNGLAAQVAVLLTAGDGAAAPAPPSSSSSSSCSSSADDEADGRECLRRVDGAGSLLRCAAEWLACGDGARWVARECGGGGSGTAAAAAAAAPAAPAAPAAVPIAPSPPPPRLLPCAEAARTELALAAHARACAATRAALAADFSLCNPPFFGSWEEARASVEAQPATACAGAPVEMACWGGEVGFVSRLIDYS